MGVWKVLTKLPFFIFLHFEALDISLNLSMELLYISFVLLCFSKKEKKITDRSQMLILCGIYSGEYFITEDAGVDAVSWQV